jgi:ATP-binding cassette subfamily B (MDR/TAP) protein 7
LARGLYKRTLSTSPGTSPSEILGKPTLVEAKKQVQTEDVEKISLGKVKESESRADARILRTLAAYLWPKDNSEFRRRVGLALCLLVLSKVLNVQVPFMFKYAIDSLSVAVGAAGATATAAATAHPLLIPLLATPTAVLLGYGIARTGASACNGQS